MGKLKDLNMYVGHKKQTAVKRPQFYRYFFVQKNSTKIKNNILLFSYTIFKIMISEKRKGERYG